ncbi:MAG: translation initiation factor IF-2 N-terminal domain-containing protein, partial [Planctomycetes bacterium]|nr:translation initiation factor IF-2 N-terminal domain-containing protein [Planctomycetota bacterium]
MAKAKRVFNIAKELGISSKAIVAKCHAEGIPQDVIKNHMSTVSVGLEATVREWFCAGSEHTAVETAEKVDLEKVRTRPRKSRAKKPAPVQPDAASETNGVAIAAPPKAIPAEEPKPATQAKLAAADAPPELDQKQPPGDAPAKTPQPATDSRAAAATATATSEPQMNVPS